VKVDVRVDRGRVDSEHAFRALVAHELGHVVGIGAHSDDPADLMFGAPSVLAPSARDARTLRYVLHQPPGYTL
jgi:predicted Zn-dependent protease